MNARDERPTEPRQTDALALIGFLSAILNLAFCLGVLWPFALVISVIAQRRRPGPLPIAGIVFAVAGMLLFAVLATAAYLFGPSLRSRAHIEADAAALAAALRAASEERAAQGLDPRVESWTDIRVQPDALTDPWERDYRLTTEQDGARFVARSAGPDGAFDTADDATIYLDADRDYAGLVLWKPATAR